MQHVPQQAREWLLGTELGLAALAAATLIVVPIVWRILKGIVRLVVLTVVAGTVLAIATCYARVGPLWP